MSDTQEPTKEQQKEWIQQALEMNGFDELKFPAESFRREIKDDVYVMFNLKDKWEPYFLTFGERSDDDVNGTLEAVGRIVSDAMTGKMPSQTKADMQYSKDAPKPHTKEENSHAEEQSAQAEETPPSTPKPAQDSTPTEIVRSTAPPAAFVPQGTMIKDILPGLAEIGAIKIGGKGEEKKSRSSDKTYRLPVKFDHFEVITKQKDEHGNFIPDATIMEIIGDDAKELNISLLYDDPSLNFFTRYNQYKGGKCMCSGDGETAIQADGTKIKCNPDTCTIFKAKHCKPNGILSVILKDAPRLGGVYKFRTTSFNSIRSILSSMFFIQSLTGGRLANIPLKMTISPMSVNPIGSPTAQTIYVVNLIYPGNVDGLRKETLQLMTEQAGMHSKMVELEAQARAAISVPETKEEIQEVEAEFYPDNAKEEAT